MNEVTVHIPQPLRSFTGGRAAVTAQGASVAAVLDDVAARHPGVGERLRTPDGALRPLVNVFLDGEDVRAREGLATRVAGGAVVSIVPAVSGGCGDTR